jgi:F0F1-type ATP synthase beta subunit
MLTANVINARLQKYTYSSRAYGANNFNIINNKKLSRIFNIIGEVVQQKGPNNRSLQNTRKHFKRRRINAMDSNKRIPPLPVGIYIVICPRTFNNCDDGRY